MDRVKLSAAEAIAMLPDKEDIHTFRNPGGMLVGADWGREIIVEAIEKCGCELSGDQATTMKHGLVLQDEHGYLFIETKAPKKVYGTCLSMCREA